MLRAGAICWARVTHQHWRKRQAQRGLGFHTLPVWRWRAVARAAPACEQWRRMQALALCEHRHQIERSMQVLLVEMEASG